MDSEMIAIKTVTEVSQLLDIPPGTLRQWEKDFEGHLVVPRDSKNQRYYMTQQIEIIRAIRDLRSKGLSIDQIKDILSEHTSGSSATTIVTSEEQTQPNPPVNTGIIASEQLLIRISELLSEKLHEQEDRFQKQIQEIVSVFQQVAPTLPAPDPVFEKHQRVTERITERRIISKLESEALQLWNQRPESERVKKTGLFKKEEDRDAKEQFIKEHVDKHFEARMKEAYGLE